MNGQLPERVVVARNDRIGDFILALPCFQLLRRCLPDAELVAYVPEYTREIAVMCPAIDRVVMDPKLGKRETIRQVTRDWRAERFDAMLALRSTWDVAWPGFLARVPVRVGPLTKAYSLLFTHRLRQQRSASTKAEWQYNLDLAQHLLGLYGIDGDAQVERPVVAADPAHVREKREMLRDAQVLDVDRPVVFVHPGQSGTSDNMSAAQYATLLRALRSPRGHSVVITAGPGEAELARELSTLLTDVEHRVFDSTEGIRAFAELIANADAFIASSTGPLHVAGMLDRPTAGFYERRITRGKLRWQTLNSPERRLGFDLQSGDDELLAAAREISERYLHAGPASGLAEAS